MTVQLPYSRVPIDAGVLASADAVILAAARSGKPFSANDLRSAFIDAGVPGRNRGGAIWRAIAAGVITPVAEVRSTDKGTHNKRISLYVGRQQVSQ